MKHWIRDYAVFLWLGFGMGLVGVTLTDWKWWAFCLPTIWLIFWRDNGRHKREETK